jgi:hypothetical protein
MATLTPTTSPKNVKRRPSGRRRTGSQAFYPAHEPHDVGISAIRNFLRCHTCYDAFPVSFRLIVLDTKLTVRKALQCLLLNGAPDSSHGAFPDSDLPSGVVSAPLWNSENSRFSGMLTVLDIIHLIQYYYRTADFVQAVTDVEIFRLESLRGRFALIL